ncbi:MAG: HTH domain-containing protein [Pseudohongiellaceae bacterium]
MEKPVILQQAVTKVLRKSGKEGMTASEILEEIRRRKLWKHNPADPEAAVRKRLSSGSQGKNPLYKKVKTGLYRLNSTYKEKASNAMREKKPAAPDKSRMTQAFGLFWHKDKVDWAGTPKLWGFQERKSPVEFCDHQGVYILYNNDKVVYVGRTDSLGFGRRLKMHTEDPSKEPWDRFSWFGIRKASDVKKGADASSGNKQLLEKAVISGLEGLLIAILSPCKNGKRGDGMKAIEWEQLSER